MADVFTRRKRSEIMSKIRSKGTSLEQNFIKCLSKSAYADGYRYRKHYKKIPGTPDIAFPRKKIAIFLDGCFWHNCPKHYKLPTSNITYWKKKSENNRLRDLQVSAECRKKGWRIIRIWEHSAKKDTNRSIQKIMKELKK